jgi:hypothetical protein
MFAPGYYKTNYRALRFRELVRMRGLRRAFSDYLVTRFKRPDGGGWMPGLWADTECGREDLSEQFWLALKPHRPHFERLGYVECGFAKVTTSLNPMVRDSGRIRYLDPTRRYAGLLTYIRLSVRSTGTEMSRVVIAFTAAFEQGALSCTNNKKGFDPALENEVIRIDSCDVGFIHQQFQNHLARRKETPREFPDQESFRQWFDARQITTFGISKRLPNETANVQATPPQPISAAPSQFLPPQNSVDLVRQLCSTCCRRSTRA